MAARYTRRSRKTFKRKRTFRRRVGRTRKAYRKRAVRRNRRTIGIGRRGFTAPTTGSYKLFSDEQNFSGKFQNINGLTQQFYIPDGGSVGFREFLTQAILRTWVDILGRNTIETFKRAAPGVGATASENQFVAVDWFDVKMQFQIRETLSGPNGITATVAQSTLPVWWGPNHTMDVLNAGDNAQNDNQNIKWVRAKAKSGGTYKYTVKWKNPYPKSKRFVPLSEMIANGNPSIGGRSEPGGRLWEFDPVRWFTQWSNISQSSSSVSEVSSGYRPNIGSFLQAVCSPPSGLLRMPALRFLQAGNSSQPSPNGANVEIIAMFETMGCYRTQGLNNYSPQ